MISKQRGLLRQIMRTNRAPSKSGAFVSLHVSGGLGDPVQGRGIRLKPSGGHPRSSILSSETQTCEATEMWFLHRAKGISSIPEMKGYYGPSLGTLILRVSPFFGRGPKDHMHVRILHSGSKAHYKGATRNLVV